MGVKGDYWHGCGQSLGLVFLVSLAGEMNFAVRLLDFYSGRTVTMVGLTEKMRNATSLTFFAVRAR